MPQDLTLIGQEDEVEANRNPYNYSPMAAVLIYTEQHKRKIPAQLSVYANVSHGLGDTVNARGWRNHIVDWMESIGF
jgi:hypothetical protein